MLRSRKRLSMWSSLPPYLGGKRRLCPVIFREIDRIVPRARWRDLRFLDAFLGGGSVSLFAKAQGLSVIATDIAERSVVIGRALVENNRVKLTREDTLRVLGARSDTPGRIESTMSPSVFTADQAKFLDAALYVAAQTSDPAKANLIRLLALRVALLCHPYAQVRKGTAHRMTTGEYESITESALYHYTDALRLHTPEKLGQLGEQINAGVFEGWATVMKRSVLDAVPEIHADVMYADPPYPGVMSYEREYKVIDEILEGASRPTSPFTAKDGANMIDHLFERATHIPIWVLSLGNAVVSIEELEAKMTKHGRRVKSIALRYQHLPAVATEQKKRENKEFVVVGVDEDAPLLGSLQVGRQIRQVVPAGIVEPDVDLDGSERPSAAGLSEQADEQREADVPDESRTRGGGEVVAEGDVCVDVPHPVLIERPVSRDSVLRLAGHDASASLGPAGNVKEETR